MGDPTNPFSDFDDDFKKTEKAELTTPGRVPPGTYKFVLTTQEIKKGVETVMADHEFFVANSGTKGFKLFCEILDPESVPNPKTGEPHVTKGAVLDHVFWGSVKNLPFLKRDLSTIIARDFRPDEKVSEVMANTSWAGLTFEGVVRDEEYNGRISSRIAFINPWQPPASDGANPDGAAKTSKETAKPDPKAETKKAETAPAKTAGLAKDAKQPAKAGGKSESW